MLGGGQEQDHSAGTNLKPHSVKVPRLYKVAANILKDFDDGKDSIKNLVFNCRYEIAKKKVVIEFLRAGRGNILKLTSREDISHWEILSGCWC